MADIVFPTSTAPGQRPGEGAGRLINCFAEKLDTGARAQFTRRRVPGLTRIAQTEHTAARGMHFHNGDLYVAQKDRLTRINIVAGVYTVTDLGDLPGELRVTFARNNKAPVPDILCVTEDDVFVVHQATPPTSLGDADLPQPLTVMFLDGYFVFPIRDGRFFNSGLNDTTINALDFGKAESHSGGLFNAVPFGEQLMLLGPSSIEVWQNAGNATGTPFSRAAVIPKGLASTFAIAGFEEGFSSLIFVGDDNGVYRLDGGYVPTKISTPDLDRLIEAVSDKALLDISVSIVSGHMRAAITGPTFTWEYELSTGFWHERASYGQSRWRAIASVKAFNDRWFYGDRATDDVWFLDPNGAREGDTQLVMSLWSLPASGFPNRVAIPRADFDIIVGTGLVAGEEPIEIDPVCLISWSDDGGATFGNPLKRNIGSLAHHKTPVSVNRTGTTSRYGRVWKIDIADPVFASVLSGTMDANPLSR